MIASGRDGRTPEREWRSSILRSAATAARLEGRGGSAVSQAPHPSRRLRRRLLRMRAFEQVDALKDASVSEADDDKPKAGLLSRWRRRDDAPAAPEAGEAARRGWLARLAAGLSRTSSTLGRGIADIFAKRKLDADALDDARGHPHPGRSRPRRRDPHPRGGRRRPLRQGNRARGGEGDPRRGNRALARAGRAAARRSTRARSRSSSSSSASTARARRRRSASSRPNSPPTGSR